MVSVMRVVQPAGNGSVIALPAKSVARAIKVGKARHLSSLFFEPNSIMFTKVVGHKGRQRDAKHDATH